MPVADDSYKYAEAEAFVCGLITSATKPPDRSPSWSWCERNVVLDGAGPLPGRYSTAFTPMVRDVMEAMQHRKTKRVVVMVSAQSAKTQLALNFLNWSISQDAGSTMWVMANADHVNEFVQKRLIPSIENCKANVGALPTDRRLCKRGLIQFPTMNLMLRGSNSRSKLQSDPVRRIFCDERREWKPGAIDLLRKRQRTFHNAIEVSLGTAGRVNDELHNDFLDGSQTCFHFRCPKCNHSQRFRWGPQTTLFRDNRESAHVVVADPPAKGGVVWETSDSTRPGGRWDFAAVAKTVRYECEQCGERFDSGDKMRLLETLHPVDYNPAAPRHLRSYNWNAIYMLWESCSWGDLVIEFLRAVEAAKIGNKEPMIAFITETLGEPWEDHLGEIEEWGFLEHRRGNYTFGDAWPDERARFLAADVQESGGQHYWWVVRAFGPFGQSRLISYGRCTTTAELEQIRSTYNVSTRNSMIDTGFKATEVYRFCQSTGWKAFKGDEQEFYAHKGAGDKVARRIWTHSLIDPASGTRLSGRVNRIPLFRFSGNATKDALVEHMQGIVGEWTIPRDTPVDYFRQMTAERRCEQQDTKGRLSYFWRRVRRDNHLWDCELMILVAAIITKVVVHRGTAVSEPEVAGV